MMSAVQPTRSDGVSATKAPVLPAGFDPVSFGIIAVGLAALFVPTFIELARVVWSTDEQGHGPIIVALSAWLLYSLRHDIAAAPVAPAPVSGWLLMVLGAVLYAVGRSQQVLMFEAATLILVIMSLLLILRGPAALRLAWFPLFFLIFMIPLPEALVAAVTAPLKTAVSTVASTLLYHLGYPIGRSGVMLTIGPYELMVADACAGLNSMFTLEALGLLYMNLMNYTAVSRNVALAALLIPVSFVANITRVMILVLVTYYFGDAAGQGFVHGFAGMVLFMVALMLMLVIDRVLGLFLPGAREKA